MADHVDKLPKEGEIIANKYLVNEVLGRGGMGLVVAATHRQLEQRVAIKFLTEEADAEMKQRFNREARAAAKLKSEHVAHVHDVGELDDGTPYMVMEYLDGADLGKISKRRGALPISEAVGYLLQASEALAEAHAVGIVHRDLKPPNLFLAENPDGTVTLKVLDFGISKDRTVESLSRTEEDLTKTSMVLGTPHFMAPEQMRSARDVDSRADIWSLGAILYQLVTGNRPFRGPTFPELVVAVIQEMPPSPRGLRPDLPVELEDAILRCLAKDPDDRFANVAELCRAIAPYGPPQSYARAERMERVLGLAPLSSAPGSAPPRSFPAPMPRSSARGSKSRPPASRRPPGSKESWYPDTEQEVGEATEPDASIGLALGRSRASVDIGVSAFDATAAAPMPLPLHGSAASSRSRGQPEPHGSAPPASLAPESSARGRDMPSMPSIGTQMTATGEPLRHGPRKGPSVRTLGAIAALSVAFLIVVAIVKPSAKRNATESPPAVAGEPAPADVGAQPAPQNAPSASPRAADSAPPPAVAVPRPRVARGPDPEPAAEPHGPLPEPTPEPAPVAPPKPVEQPPAPKAPAPKAPTPKAPTPKPPTPTPAPPAPPPVPKNNPLDMELK